MSAPDNPSGATKPGNYSTALEPLQGVPGRRATLIPPHVVRAFATKVACTFLRSVIESLQSIRRSAWAQSGIMVVPAELLASRPRLRVKYGRKSSAAVGRDKRAQLRRATEEDLAQRLYSIILAVHAAEHELGENPERLAAILELIHLQSAASLEDLRRLGALG